jgi:hypothetical protein
MPPPAFGAPPGTADGKLARRPVKPKDLGQKLKETILAKCVPPPRFQSPNEPEHKAYGGWLTLSTVVGGGTAHRQ